MSASTTGTKTDTASVTNGVFTDTDSVDVVVASAAGVSDYVIILSLFVLIQAPMGSSQLNPELSFLIFLLFVVSQSVCLSWHGLVMLKYETLRFREMPPSVVLKKYPLHVKSSPDSLDYSPLGFLPPRLEGKINLHLKVSKIPF